MWWDTDWPEGFIDGSEPAEEGAGREQDEPEDGQTEVHTCVCVSGELS